MASDANIGEKPDWRHHGLRIIRSGEPDTDTPQDSSMSDSTQLGSLLPVRRRSLTCASSHA